MDGDFSIFIPDSQRILQGLSNEISFVFLIPMGRLSKLLKHFCKNQASTTLCPLVYVSNSCQKYILADALNLVYISQLYLTVRSTNYSWSTAWIGTRLKTRKITAKIFAVHYFEDKGTCYW